MTKRKKSHSPKRVNRTKSPKLLGPPTGMEATPSKSVTLGDGTVVTAPASGLKLDLGCGGSLVNPNDQAGLARAADGFQGVDRAAMPGVTHVVNLFRFPWPFEDDSVSEIYCSHFIEHIPMIEVDYETGEPVPYGEGIDLFLRFFDECYRVMKHEGWMHVIAPSSRNDRAFQDPTHRRFINTNTFYYLWKEWREANGLAHYGAKCDMRGVQVTFSMDQVFAAKSPEVQAREVNLWNQMIDVYAHLQAQKPT